ncbi:MAG: ATP-binding protein [Wenzhouxiangella sp.]|nr:ATP-binding protein [Wenzhouxiangella sp.]
MSTAPLSLFRSSGLRQEHPESLGDWLIRSIALIALYYAVGLWGVVFTPDSHGIPLVWPATGVGLAFVYLYGYRLLPALGLATALVLWRLSGEMMRVSEALGVVLATLAGVGLGAYALRRLGFSAGIERVRDVVLLFVIGGLSASGLAAAAGAWGVAVNMDELRFTDTWWLCWVADLMGLMLVAPVLITWFGSSLRRPLDVGIPTLVALTAGLTLVAGLVYSGLLETGIAMPLSYAVFPLVMLAALRCPIQMTTTLTLVAGGIALSGTGWGVGPFADAEMERSLLSLNAQLALLVLTGLVLSALRSERESAEARARQHLDELARAGRLSTLGELSASLAHELNQPLCALTSYTHASRRLLEQQRFEALGDALAQLDASAHRTAETVRQMRALASGASPETVAIAPAELIGSVLELLKPDFRRRNVRVDTDLAESLPLAIAAPVQIEQVLINLLRNAMDAVEGRERARIRIAVSASAEEILIAVSDNGTGIPQGRLDSLFDAFATWKSGGIGLGLSISRSLVEAHGGQLTATNLEGGGARFSFTLPREAHHAES